MMRVFTMPAQVRWFEKEDAIREFLREKWKMTPVEVEEYIIFWRDIASFQTEHVRSLVLEEFNIRVIIEWEYENKKDILVSSYELGLGEFFSLKERQLDGGRPLNIYL